MMKPTRFLALACASVVAVAPAGAQDAPNLRGKVKSVSGNPIEGVEVRVEGSGFVTRSGRDGTFAFVNAPKGPQLLLFRLLGYLPAKSEVRVPTADPVEVSMLPTPRNLDTVRVVASLNVLAGVVVDHKDQPIPGATVEMLAGPITTVTTDSSGWFNFTSVGEGSGLGLLIPREPIDDKLSGSRLEDASGFGNASTFVWRETQQRVAMKGVRAIVIPREELAP